MLCEKCGLEIKENLVKFKKLGIEVNFAQEQKGVKFKEIKIPKGWRLLRFNELSEVMNYIVENKLNIWSYFEQPINIFKGKWVAWFGAGDGGAGLSCYWDPDSSDPSPEVILCREIKI